MNTVIRVIIADDHLVVRTGLRLMLATSEDFEIVGEATDGATAVELTEQLQPDVVLVDLRMPVMDGLEAIARIHDKFPQIATVILTTYNEDDLIIRGLQAGASGYLLKDCTIETLLNALRSAARGETLVQPEIMARILSHAARVVTPREISAPPAANSPRNALELTEREQEVLLGVARGQRSKEIAIHLGISERTVGSYLNNIFAKLGVDSRASAVAVALERNLLPKQR
jgi:NarL family two-component system response regulator YdfI